jgi:hypothetical protein
MSFLKKLSKSVVKIAKAGAGVLPWDKKLAKETFRRGNMSPLLGHFDEMRSDKASGEAAAKAEKQAQLDLLQKQQNAAENALADLSLLNTPDVIAGGAASNLAMGTGRKRRGGQRAMGSIATQLGVG